MFWCAGPGIIFIVVVVVVVSCSSYISGPREREVVIIWQILVCFIYASH